MDLANKVKADPLFAIKKKEQQAKKALLRNPVKMKQLQKFVSMLFYSANMHDLGSISTTWDFEFIFKQLEENVKKSRKKKSKKRSKSSSDNEDGDDSYRRKSKKLKYKRGNSNTSSNCNPRKSAHSDNSDSGKYHNRTDKNSGRRFRYDDTNFEKHKKHTKHNFCESEEHRLVARSSNKRKYDSSDDDVKLIKYGLIVSI